MAREVLGGRQHVRRVDAVNDGSPRGGDSARARAIAAAPHDRRGTVANVRNRAEVEVKSERLDRARHLHSSRLPDWHRLTRHSADGQADLATLLIGGSD